MTSDRGMQLGNPAQLSLEAGTELNALQAACTKLAACRASLASRLLWLRINLTLPRIG